MEDYTQKWQQASLCLNPLIPDPDGRILYDKIFNSRIRQELSDFRKYLVEIDNYKVYCLQLHETPNNPKVQKDLQQMEVKLAGQANNIERDCQNILKICSEIIQLLITENKKIKSVELRNDMADFTKILKGIITGIKQDEQNFSPRRIQVTLENIRRNPN
jgi:hypothetical protein